MDMRSSWGRIFFKVIGFLQSNNWRFETHPKILAQSEVYYTTTKGVRALHGSKFFFIILWLKGDFYTWIESNSSFVLIYISNLICEGQLWSLFVSFENCLN